MAGKNLLIGNLKNHFEAFESQIKQFFFDMVNTQYLQDTPVAISKISDHLFQINSKLGEFKILFSTNHIVLGN